MENISSEKPAQAAAANSRKWLILIAVGASSLMSALDGSVVNIILPTIRQTFGSEVATVEWVVVVYLLVVSGCLLAFGRLGDLKGHRVVFLSGLLIFILGSALCGMASSAPALIACRAVQALGAAMLFANSPAILTKSFPSTKRGQALGAQATMTYLGSTIGPSFGGWLAQSLGWRSVFYINVPLGLAALALGWFFIPTDQHETKEESFDLKGAGLFMTGLVALLLGLNQGHAWGWSSPAILGLLVFSVILLGLFIRLEKHTPTDPMLDLSLFRRKTFSVATASAIMNYIAISSTIFIMPFYLIQGRNFSTASAGLILTAQPLIMAVIAPISGTLSDRVGSRWPATIGMLILSAGLFSLSQIGPTTSQVTILLSLGICGLGTGIFISPNTSALMGAAPRNRQGIASGTMATARNLGMVLGVGISGAILTTFLESNLSDAIFSATHAAFLVTCSIALISSVTSFMRGNESQDQGSTALIYAHLYYQTPEFVVEFAFGLRRNIGIQLTQPTRKPEPNC